MTFKSTQVKGRGRGKLLGYPTINFVIPENFALENGIYAVWVKIRNKKFKGALHYGPIPTFHDDNKSLEVFIIDIGDPEFTLFEEEIVEIETIKKLRDIMNFKTPEELTLQMSKDVKQVLTL